MPRLLQFCGIGPPFFLPSQHQFPPVSLNPSPASGRARGKKLASETLPAGSEPSEVLALLAVEVLIDDQMNLRGGRTLWSNWSRTCFCRDFINWWNLYL